MDGIISNSISFSDGYIVTSRFLVSGFVNDHPFSRIAKLKIHKSPLVSRAALSAKQYEFSTGYLEPFFGYGAVLHKRTTCSGQASGGLLFLRNQPARSITLILSARVKQGDKTDKHLRGAYSRKTIF